MRDLSDAQRPSLRGAKRADVVIVGGGLSGLTTAMLLSSHGARVTLVEAHRLGDGATLVCGGAVTAQMPGIYERAVAWAGMERGRVLCRLAQEAVQGVGAWAMAHPCGWQENRAYVYASAGDRSLQALLRMEQRLHLPVTEALDADDCPVPAEGALRLDHQGFLDPARYGAALAEAAEMQGCRLYEGSPALSLEDGRVYTPEGHVDADVMILATAVPIGCRSLPRLAMMTQHACVQHHLTSIAPLHNTFLPQGEEGITFAPCRGGLLTAQDVGIAGQRGQERRYRRAEEDLRAVLPDAPVKARVLRQECHSADGLPLIGALHPRHDRLLVATGYGGWGIPLSYLAAQVLTGHLTGRPMSEAAVFAPFRGMHRGAVLRPGIIRMTAAFAGGALRPAAPVCPHMGGRLRYDGQARRWVCPCHGATFDIIGRVMSAPAMADAVIHRRQHPYE